MMTTMTFVRSTASWRLLLFFAATTTTTTTTWNNNSCFCLAADPIVHNDDSSIELFLDLVEGPETSDPNFVYISGTEFNEGLGRPFALFEALDVATDTTALYFTDGTVDGTQQQQLLESSSLASLLVQEFNNKYYFGQLKFGGSTDASFYELWVTEGTKATTVQVANIAFDDAPREFLVFDDHLYFVIQSQLWKTDGTASGTVLVKDFVTNFENFGGGSTMISDLRIRDLGRIDNDDNVDGDSDSDSYMLLALHFSIVTTSTQEDEDGFPTTTTTFEDSGQLVRSDGTEDGTSILAISIPNPRLRPSNRSPMIGLNVFVGAGDGLWSTDGTPGGTERIYGDGGRVRSISTPLVDGKVAFIADNGRSFIMTSDGTTDGTVPLNVTATTDDEDDEVFTTTFEEYLDFGAVSTFGGTIAFGPAGLNNGGFLTFVANGVGTDSSDGLYIWSTGGTSDTTDVIGVAIGAQPYDSTLLTDGRFVIRTYLLDNTDQVWITDGTKDGTMLLVEFTNGEYPDGGTTVVDLGDNTLLVTGSSSETGMEIWKLTIPPAAAADPMDSNTVGEATDGADDGNSSDGGNKNMFSPSILPFLVVMTTVMSC